jgi:hypothetical protein
MATLKRIGEPGLFRRVVFGWRLWRSDSAISADRLGRLWLTKSEKLELASRARAGSGSLLFPPFGYPSRNVVRGD